MNRILYNEDGDDIDELVVEGVEAVHIEQMSERCWWFGIHMPDGSRWSGNFVANSRGRMTFTEQEDSGVGWDEVDQHKRPD